MLKAFMELSALHKVFTAAQGVLERDLRTPSCIPGCGRCCHVVDCMVIEGADMVSGLIGEGRLEQVAQIAEDWLLHRHPEATIYRGLPVGAVPGDLKREWEALQATSCPFLDEQSKCVIYSSRPLICRAYGVTRDIPYCQRPLGIGEHSTRRGYIDNTEIRQVVEDFKHYCSKYPEWTIRGFIPSILYRAAYPPKFRAMVDDNKIASAKIIGTQMDFSLMWHPEEQNDLVQYQTHVLNVGRD